MKMQFCGQCMYILQKYQINFELGQAKKVSDMKSATMFVHDLEVIVFRYINKIITG